MINYVALLVASIVGYIIPMIWYAPPLFGKKWMKYSGIKEMKMNPAIMFGGFIITIIFNGVISWIIGLANITTFVQGMGIGAILWLGFIATSQLDSVLYTKRPVALYWITSIQYLISMVIVGGILAVWQ